MNKDSDIRLLKEEISRYPDDSIQLVSRLIKFAEMLRLNGSSFDAVIVNVVRALEMSRRLKNLDAEALSLCTLARNNLLFYKKEEALKYIHESLNLELKVKPLVRARIFCEYAFILQENGELIESYQYLESALNIGLQENNESILSRIYGYLSRLSCILDDFDSGIFFSNKALTFQNPQPSVTRHLDLLGYLYFSK
jgi:tetratricopeptide (TPR) repeat protein